MSLLPWETQVLLQVLQCCEAGCCGSPRLNGLAHGGERDSAWTPSRFRPSLGALVGTTDQLCQYFHPVAIVQYAVTPIGKARFCLYNITLLQTREVPQPNMHSMPSSGKHIALFCYEFMNLLLNSYITI